ncbi:cysteine--tRNA ligase [Anaerotalea alkaliphila]|uniref:Cysteine--tRNA ligase n=1 Tax=Anaerotalea alkaliphila TaxID=2662126 RepID=A0A7X5HX27_9FIRM|nr:cysteine--tRNA ligase [Anaerotalea alkaliphila]NDL68205.1 cysteine--tRNA ligase [Anaerotalea alkaliphila]
MKLYNTLSRSVEEFVPLQDRQVGIYTCGPTVYNYAHVGNLKTYIMEDALVKSLEYLGYSVKRVMNVTDVGHLESDADDGEDKMLKGAARENKTVWEVAAYYTDAFFADCAKLNIKEPTVVAKATDFIGDYIEMIRTLEAKGFTYTANGNVYFDISRFPEYTKLSRMNLEDLQTASRDGVEEDLHKKNPQDFVLWFTKSKFENQAMKWDSPWGVGYPGWHLECSVIALKHLGPQMDIHCGGVDHIPVHHTNEIAQTESYTGKPWVKYWWHGEFLLDNSGKMSKSKGEFLTLSLLEKKGFNPLVYRFYVLGSHYRKQLVFTYESLEMAKTAYGKLRNKVLAVKKAAEAEAGNPQRHPALAERYDQDFKNCLADDMNISNAITVLHEVLKEGELSPVEKLELVRAFDTVLGLDLDKETVEEFTEEELEFIREQIGKRAEAKKAKDFALADGIRNQLLEKGIAIEDTREGVKFKRA